MNVDDRTLPVSAAQHEVWLAQQLATDTSLFRIAESANHVRLPSQQSIARRAAFASPTNVTTKPGSGRSN